MTALAEGSSRQPLRAPVEDGGTLVVPPLADAAVFLVDCRSRGFLHAATHGSPEHALRSAGDPWVKLAVRARAELLESAWQYTTTYRDAPRPDLNAPLVMAGHQPQMFHPGVWCKNFLLSRMALERRCTAVNLVVDNDTLKAACVRVPAGSVESPHSSAVEFDAAAEPVSFEERKIVDPVTFASFGKRAAETLSTFVKQPLLGEYWPLVLERAQETNTLGECLAQARHRLEAAWGLQSLELPLSVVCGLPAFAEFVSHMLRRGAEFRLVHNAALAAYRRVNRIRSAHHPVPELAEDGDWTETPFWVWTAQDHRRRRLFVRRVGTEWALTDRGHWQSQISASAAFDGGPAPDALAGLARQGIKLRTRALTTTLWARLFLGDLFVHGIGGAKYDQLTDELIRVFFGVAPPPYMVATATLRLPIARPSMTVNHLRQIHAKSRDMQFHPESFVDPMQAAEQIAAKHAAVSLPHTRVTAKARGQEIRAANAALQGFLYRPREQLHAQQQVLESRWRAEGVLASREYAFPLFPSLPLKDFLLEFPFQKAYT